MHRKSLHLVVFGAHVGDAELTAGAALAKHTRAGHKATIVHMTAGEKGHPKMAPEEYAKQKRREAEDSAKVLGAHVRFLSYRDAELPVNREVKMAVCDLVRELKPDVVITHWRGSWHRDHVNTYRNVMEGIFYAGLPAVQRGLPAHGFSNVYFADNWEDPLGFKPHVFLDVTEVFDIYVEAINKHEFARGVFSGFPYIDYYKALAVVRGAVAGFKYAQAFMAPEWAGKRRVQYFP